MCGGMTAQEFLPAAKASLTKLREAVQECRGCELYQQATQAVFGEGPARAQAMLIGETPGDVEDKQGHPFVGPAGRLLEKALGELGYSRAQVYLTNAVKHFRWRPAERGKRRIHQTPGRTHIVACRPWLVAELNRVRPEIVVVLGSVAAQSLLGPAFRVTRSRGELLPWPQATPDPSEFPGAQGRLVATVHPSAVLRADDREAAYKDFLKDLAIVFKPG